MMMTKSGGRWVIVDPKHYDYQLSIVLTLVNVTITIMLYGDSIEREILEKIYIFCYVDIIGSDEFFRVLQYVDIIGSGIFQSRLLC